MWFCAGKSETALLNRLTSPSDLISSSSAVRIRFHPKGQRYINCVTPDNITLMSVFILHYTINNKQPHLQFSTDLRG